MASFLRCYTKTRTSDNVIKLSYRVESDKPLLDFSLAVRPEAMEAARIYRLSPSHQLVRSCIGQLENIGSPG